MSESIFSLPGWTKGTFSGVTYNYLRIKASSEDKPTFVCFHGFPNGPLAYRKILPLLTAQGYGVILPELLGYGETDRPTDPTAYSRVLIADAVAGILAAEKVDDNIIVLGHDWGATVAGRFAQKYSQKVQALILVGVPFFPPEPGVFDAALLNKLFKPATGYEPFGYMEFFITPEAPKIISEHLESFVYGILNEDVGHVFCDRGALQTNLPQDLKLPCAPWVKEDDIQVLYDYLQRNDINILLNWYRSALLHPDDRDAELPKRMTLPYLFLSCENDPTTPSQISDKQGEHCDNLTTKSFPTGHWLLEEDPKGAWTAIEAWLPTVLRE